MLGQVKSQRREQAQESRRKLMESALSLFAEKGFAGTNMRAISRGAGMADGLLYHYFPGGKQELLVEIVREKLGDIEKYARRWDVELMELPLEEALDRVFTAAVEIFEKNLELFRLVVREESHRVVEFGQVYQMLLGQQHWLPALLEGQIAQGKLRPVDIACTADTMLALITNYFLGRLTGLEEHYYYTEEHCRKLLRHQCALLRADAVVPKAEGEGV